MDSCGSRCTRTCCTSRYGSPRTCSYSGRGATGSCPRACRAEADHHGSRGRRAYRDAACRAYGGADAGGFGDDEGFGDDDEGVTYAAAGGVDAVEAGAVVEAAGGAEADRYQLAGA